MKWIDRLILHVANPVITREMNGWKVYLDLQHGIKYTLYADSLQASVNRLKEHVDKVKSICAQQIEGMKEQHLADRQVILTQNARIAELERQMEEIKNAH